MPAQASRRRAPASHEARARSVAGGFRPSRRARTAGVCYGLDMSVSAPKPGIEAEAPRHGPGLSGVSWFDSEDAPARRDINTCIHCGLCLTACPTYRELKIEPDSPRGRIYLMRGLAEGRIAPSEEPVQHLDLCLDCRACETVCPAGVPYSRMLEEARGQLERRRPAGGAGRSLGRLALTLLFPNRGLMHAAAGALRLAQSGPLAAAIH